MTHGAGGSPGVPRQTWSYGFFVASSPQLQGESLTVLVWEVANGGKWRLRRPIPQSSWSMQRPQLCFWPHEQVCRLRSGEAVQVQFLDSPTGTFFPHLNEDVLASSVQSAPGELKLTVNFIAALQTIAHSSLEGVWPRRVIKMDTFRRTAIEWGTNVPSLGVFRGAVEFFTDSNCRQARRANVYVGSMRLENVAVVGRDWKDSRRSEYFGPTSVIVLGLARRRVDAPEEHKDCCITLLNLFSL